MIKAKVIEPFYVKQDTFLYLDEDRFNELKEKGKVVKEKDCKKTIPKEKTVYKTIIDKESLETR